MAKFGQDFEKAVYVFAKAINKSSEVLFNHKVRDKDTGTIRQCDVWINGTIAGHWPISILISCKDHTRKLNIQDIDSFHQEVRSTGASTGVIYCRNGFTKNALLKAKANGLSCCQLLKKYPDKLPLKLWFDSFVCSTSIRLSIIYNSIPGLVSFDDIFNIPIEGKSVIEFIKEIFHDFESKSVEEAKCSAGFPKEFSFDASFSHRNLNECKIILRIFGHWKKYRGTTEASLINGSYCLTNNSFSGTQGTPVIDRRGPHPGPGWTEILENDFLLPKNRIIIFLYHGSFEEQLREKLGPNAISPYMVQNI